MMSRHHLIPKGRKRKPPILILDWERHHKAWHALFGNRTLLEAIAVLQRIAQVKEVQDGTSL